MTHGSLFSGIGGFDLAAEWMGWENKFHCEWNPFGQRVLKYYWPDTESFHDITKTDFTKYANKIDILTGGFPCQPYSSAGKRLGKDDDRHLFPEMLRAIREIAPRFIVGENVRGLTNWNGGLVFDEVCAELENLGYQVAPFIIPACAVNAPHKRERVWFVAYRQDIRYEETEKTGFRRQKQKPNNGKDLWSTFNKYGRCGNATDSKCTRLQSSNKTRNIRSVSSEEVSRRNSSSKTIESDGNEWRTRPANQWHSFPTQSPICGGDDGLPTELDGITFSKWRNESIKAYGNAVCPQLVLQIFKAIEQYEKNQTTRTRCR